MTDIISFPLSRTRRPAPPSPAVCDLERIRRNLARSYVETLAVIDAAIDAANQTQGEKP